MVGQPENGLITYAQFERRSRWPRLSWLGRQLADWRVAKWLLVLIVVVIDIAMYLQVTQRPAMKAAAAPRGVITAAPRIVVAATPRAPKLSKSTDTSKAPAERVAVQLQIDGQVQEFSGEWISIQSGTRQYLYSAVDGKIKMSTVDASTPGRPATDDGSTGDRTVTVRTPKGTVTLTGEFQIPKLPADE